MLPCAGFPTTFLALEEGALEEAIFGLDETGGGSSSEKDSQAGSSLVTSSGGLSVEYPGVEDWILRNRRDYEI